MTLAFKMSLRNNELFYTQSLGAGGRLKMKQLKLVWGCGWRN